MNLKNLPPDQAAALDALLKTIVQTVMQMTEEELGARVPPSTARSITTTWTPREFFLAFVLPLATREFLREIIEKFILEEDNEKACTTMEALCLSLTKRAIASAQLATHSADQALRTASRHH